MNQRLGGLLKSIAGYLAMAALVGGLGFFMVHLLDQSEILHEISPDAGMTKHCSQNGDGTLACSQVPTAPADVAPAPDLNAPLYVTVGVE